MRRSIPTLACLVISGLLATTSVARADAVVPCGGSSCLPTVIITVGSEVYTPTVAGSPGQKAFTIPVSVRSGNGEWELGGTISTDADPFIQYAIGFTNTANLNQTFTIAVQQPFLLGPYDQLLSSHSSNVTDGAGGSVTIAPTSGTVHTPAINFVQGGGALGAGCTVNVGPGFTGPCELGNYLAPYGPTTVAGTLGVTLSATVSPKDSYAATGRVELLTAVPEPGTFTLFGAGLCALVRRMRRK